MRTTSLINTFLTQRGVLTSTGGYWLLQRVTDLYRAAPTSTEGH